MATEPTIFVFANAEIRVVMLDDAPHFVGKDVCDRLGYADATNAMKQHCKGVVKRHPLSTPGGMQEVRVLSEPDVLRLIVRSKLPEAQQFERWVFEEVLPAIRKSGGYMVAAPDETPEALALRAMTVMQATIERQKAQIEAAQPVIEAHARIAGADGSLNVTEAAKSLQMKPANLFSWLSCNGWIYKRPGSANWLGYQSRTNAGDLTHKVTTVLRSDGSEKITEQVRITPNGLDKLARLIPGRPSLAA
ncbi:phage antirepressor KilAC domain-containing protein [Asaia bogorensis]|uniref:phage antirepressor KilAC domain-containing protein n=1 Tax=Asaia bogorensis TaxID=91915 RepID=UPI003016CBD8